MAKQFFTVKRTAQRLDVGEPTIRRWILEGKLAAVRVGTRAIRVQADSVAQLLSPRTLTK
jgi:excisionase family DNA binding protein